MRRLCGMMVRILLKSLRTEAKPDEFLTYEQFHQASKGCIFRIYLSFIFIFIYSNDCLQRL